MSIQNETKLTDEHRAFIAEATDAGMTNVAIRTELLKKFNLPEEFISATRVAQLAAKRRKKNKREKKKSPNDTEEEEKEEEPIPTTTVLPDSDTVAYKDLKEILKPLIPKNPSKIDTIVYAWENTPNPDVWKLLKILEINSFSPIQRRQVVLQYYGLETVQKIWVDSGSIDTPTIKKDVTNEVDELTESMMKQIKNKISMEQLKDLYREIKAKDNPDDPLANMKHRLEYQQLLTQMQHAEETSALSMFREFRNMQKDESKQENSFLTQVKTMKELGMIGDQKEERYMTFLQAQLDNTNRQLEAMKDNSQQLRDLVLNQQQKYLEEQYKQQLQIIKDNSMTREGWEQFEQSRHAWATKNGYVDQRTLAATNSRETAALQRIEKLQQVVEDLPNKIQQMGNQFLEQGSDMVTKLADLQDRRFLQQQQREQRAAVMNRQTSRPQAPPLNQNAVLDHLEQKLTSREVWKKVKEAADKTVS